MIRRVAGRSMLPTLSDGQLVVYAPFLKVKRGDLVVAETTKREVIKRVLSIENKSFHLVSDNKEEGAEYRVQKTDILGKVVWPLQK